MRCCSDVKFVFHWHLFKPVEPVLNGQPVLSGQLAIPQEWPINTGLTVIRREGSYVFFAGEFQDKHANFLSESFPLRSTDL